MTLGDRVIFASIMTLLETLEENITKDTYSSADYEYSGDDYKYSVPEFTPNAPNYIERLCNIVQNMFDDASAACGTEPDLSASELIPSMICGIIFEMTESLSVDNYEKRKIYRSSSHFCGVENVFSEEHLFGYVDTRMAESLTLLTDMRFEVITVVSQECKNSNALTGFVEIFAEFMLFLEKELSELYPNVTIDKRPSLLVVEKTLFIMKKHLHQLEEEHPEFKTSSQENSNADEEISTLLTSARNERQNGNMEQSAAYYTQVLEIHPDNWEACFYSIFCSVYFTTHTVNPDNIPEYTKKICDCTSKAMGLAKNQLYSRMEKIDAIGGIASGIFEIATNYFIAALNRYKNLVHTAKVNDTKNAQVNSIIQMLFSVGDSIEENFNDDIELCAYTACACWEIAFDCYEKCNMPTPIGVPEHLQKIKEYIPNFRCAKPISNNTSPSSTTTQQSSVNSEGCYIATAIYGSYDCPPVWTLRRFRDQFLASKWYGRLFVRFYYTVSPKLVKLLKDKKWFNEIFKYLLDKMVINLSQKGYKNTEYSDVT